MGMNVDLAVFETINERRSIRAYTEEEVSEKDVDQLIEASRWIPSAGNTQQLESVVLTDLETKWKLSGAGLNQTFIKKSPVISVIFADVHRSDRSYGNRGKKLYSKQDTAATTQNILLTTHELGLTTCWIEVFNDKRVVKTVKAPRSIKHVAIYPIGHSAERHTTPPKRPVKEIVHYETFRGKHNGR